jgi:hypothetical protein
LQSHQTQHRTASKSLFFLSCGASTRFQATVSPYEASRSHSLDTPYSVGFLWSSDQPDAETLTTHNISQETNIHVPAGFDPTSPASERQRSHAIDRAATEIGSSLLHAVGASTVLVRLCRASGRIPQQVHVHFSITLWPAKTWVDANFYMQAATK